MRSRIQWTGDTWNPLKARTRERIEIPLVKGRLKVIEAGTVGYHCERVGSDCLKCYSCAGNRRTLPNWGTGLDYTRQSRDQVEIILDDDVLGEPLTWRTPRLVFPCSMTDLFGEFVSDEQIAEVFRVMARTPQHTYQVVTKRAERMAEIMPRIYATFGAMPHVWMGVSIGTLKGLERLTHLRKVGPASSGQEGALERDQVIRWVSFEPLLEDLGDPDLFGIAWAVLGLESGPGARGDIDHLMRLLGRVRSHGVAAYVKQLGSRYARMRKLGDGSGGDIEEWPRQYRVREYPRGFIPPQRRERARRAA